MDGSSVRAILRRMSETIVSEAEARERLPDLIDRALAGEQVRITRDGGGAVEMRAAPEAASCREALPRGLIDLEWLRRHRVGDRQQVTEDAGTLVSRMRDEDWR